MSVQLLRKLSLGIALGAAWLPTPSLAWAEDFESRPMRIVKLVSADDDPDEGIPGGSVRILAPHEIDPTPALPATGPEREAAAAEGPTMEAIPEKAPLAPTDSIEPELKPELVRLRKKVREALAIYYPKHLNTRDNSPWEVMHGIIAYGVDAKMFRGAASGEEVNAIGWMCFNGACRGEQLFYVNNGEIVARQGPGLQGHFGQFLAIIAQCHVKRDYPLNVNGRSFTIESLVEHEKMDCQAGEELTFKLIGLMHYLDSDATWQNRDGQTWSIQRLVHEELAQSIRGSACGGTHRLMGLSYAVNKRIQRAQPITGEFRRAQIFVNDYHRYTFSLQNPDGSFSTEWFAKRGANPDIDRRLKTTGHITEWLSYSLTDDDLLDARMIKAVEYLATTLVNRPDHTWEIGPLGHGLHALRIYDRRVFKPLDPPATVAAWLDPANATERVPAASTAKIKTGAKQF